MTSPDPNLGLEGSHRWPRVTITPLTPGADNTAVSWTNGPKWSSVILSAPSIRHSREVKSGGKTEQRQDDIHKRLLLSMFQFSMLYSCLWAMLIEHNHSLSVKLGFSGREALKDKVIWSKTNTQYSFQIMLWTFDE